MLSSGCATAVSDPVLPPLDAYAPAVQSRAADELSALGPSCPRTEAPPGCSAVATLIADYLTLRDRIRAAAE